MTHTEFFERTKVTVDGNQYEKIQAVYAEVEMDKDEFCAEWKKLRNNRLMGEIEEAMHRMEHQMTEKDSEIRRLNGMLEEKDRYHIDEMEKQAKRIGNGQLEFARKLILAGMDAKRLYDVIEEEYGIRFIIKTKHEAGLPLSEEEIEYMVGTL